MFRLPPQTLPCVLDNTLHSSLALCSPHPQTCTTAHARPIALSTARINMSPRREPPQSWGRGPPVRTVAFLRRGPDRLIGTPLVLAGCSSRVWGGYPIRGAWTRRRLARSDHKRIQPSSSWECRATSGNKRHQRNIRGRQHLLHPP
jgi:hypothetical protein